MDMHIRQEQRQILSPQLYQTMELVMLPALSLKEKIEEEARANPAIQLERKKPESSRTVHRSRSTGGFDSQSYLENLSVYDFNLYKFMMEQVQSEDFTERQTRIAEIILSSIADNGLLQSGDSKGMSGPIDPARLIEGTSYTLEEFEETRRRIMRLDPLGIGCYSTHEYLSLQAGEKFGKNSIEYRILSDCLEWLEKKNFSRIARELKVPFERVEQAIASIATLNIVPASHFSQARSLYVVPDAFVNVTEDGIDLVLNDDYIPDVRLNQQTLHLYEKNEFKNRKTKLDKDDKLFLRENIDKARRLIENLRTRKEIVFKVILKIVEKQKDYFLKGPHYQVPLKLKDIADEINVSESTVSRVVREKYIQTNKGIINLKHFFSTNIGNQETSAMSVKEKLKQLIESEDRNDPFSDDKIVQLMQKKGITISRRTVAKYRAELKIPPAHMRRNPI